MRVLAIDPGESCGLAVLRVTPGRVEQVEALTAHPGLVYSRLARPQVPTWRVDAVVYEEFRLYPWLATHQGFSTLPTVEVIGVIKYLCAEHALPCYGQRADIKKEARYLAESHGWPMKVRSLGSGKGKYRGPDFAIPGPQHPRDAVAHGCYWAWRNVHSPAYEG